LGIQLRRFDVLWHIRKRFVEGVEPAKESGREWAKEVLVAIPFIGSLASIGSAISAVGQKVVPKFKTKYGDVGDWLQSRLGKDYIGKLLEILWKEPRHAEFIYLDALLEDLNNRRSKDDPLLVLLDHFEFVDNEQKRWRYRKKKISEAELWCVFLSSLTCSVGVMASRHAAPKGALKEFEFEEQELTELDQVSSIQLLEEHGVNNKDLQNAIASVSGGNPFVIEAICDIIETSEVSVSDIEDLHAETLSEVRLKVWRRLFSHAEGLLNMINRAGVVPYFNEEIMSIITPEMTSDSWDRFLQLSFLKVRDDKTIILHELAQDMVIAELGRNLKKVALEVGELLEAASKEKSDYALLGLGLSARALVEEPEVLKEIDILVVSRLWEYDTANAMKLLEAFSIESEEGLIVKETQRGYIFNMLNRYVEAEESIQSAMTIAKELSEEGPPQKKLYLGRALWFQGRHFQDSEQYYDAEIAFRKALEFVRETDAQGPFESFMKDDLLVTTLHILGFHLSTLYRLEEAEELVREAITILEKQPASLDLGLQKRRDTILRHSQRNMAQILNMSGRISEAQEILKDILKTCVEQAMKNSARHLLAYTLINQKRHEEGLDIFNQIYEDVKKLILGDSDYQYATKLSLSHLILPNALTGRYQKAERILEEILPEFRKSVKEGEPLGMMLARILRDSAVIHSLSGRLSEAEEMNLESVDILRDLADKYPDRYGWRLAASLNSLGIVHSHMNKMKSAEHTLQEAYSLAKEMATKYPDAVYIVDTYGALANNTGYHLMKNKRFDDAERYLREAHDIWKELSNNSPDLFLPRLATSLNNIGVLLSETDQISQAESLFQEILKTRRSFVEKSPNFFKPRVASVLNNLGILYCRTDRPSKAEEVYNEAIAILEEFAAKEPRVHNRDLIRVLGNALVLYIKTEDSSNVNRIKTRLEEIGGEKLPTDEKWTIDVVYLQGF
jgi:tetratricopeptide (TPR) repeat protein